MFNYLRNISHHGTCSSTFSAQAHSVQSSEPTKPFSVQLLNQFSHNTSAHVQHNVLQNLKHELNLAVNRIVHHGVRSEIGAQAQQEIAQVVLGLADKLASGDVHFKNRGAAIRLILRILNPDQIENHLVKGVNQKKLHGLQNITRNPSVKPHLYTTATWLELSGKLIGVFSDLSEKKMNDVGAAIFSTLCDREKELAPRDLASVLVFMYGTFLKYTVARNVYLGQSMSDIEQSKTKLTRVISPEHLIAKQAYFINKLEKNSADYYRVQKALQWAQYESSLFSFTCSSSYSGENVPSPGSISAYNDRIQNMRISIVQQTGADVYDDWLERLADKCESRPLDVIWANSVHTLYKAALAARPNQS